MQPALHPILDETLLTFAEAAAAIPKVGGRATSMKSIYKWADVGVKLGGQFIRLETCRLGGRRVTSREALTRFLAATSAMPDYQAPIPRAPETITKASIKAGEFVQKELDRILKGRKAK